MKELKAYHAFIGKTLSEGPDGVVAEWTAPKTPFKGKVTPAARFKEGARECRDATMNGTAAIAMLAESTPSAGTTKENGASRALHRKGSSENGSVPFFVQ